MGYSHILVCVCVRVCVIKEKWPSILETDGGTHGILKGKDMGGFKEKRGMGD